jgi:MFS transporter, DHA2 family, multidrug resistance protein
MTTLDEPTTVRAGRRAWIGLAVLALPTLLVSIDVFVMLLALPHLSEALHASSTEQLWIMDMYSFALSGFMITMGTLGDRIGRRRLLLIGATAFGAASVLAAFSTSAGMLIVARGLLGVAGATIAPCALALISNMFRDPKQRGVAIGIWLACFMGGAMIGPIVGGFLLDHFWWGSVFLVGVPAMVLLLVFGPILLPEYRDGRAGRIDLTSVGLSLGAILPVVYGLKEIAKDGVSTGPLTALVLGAFFGILFVRRQHRLADPLIELRLFRSRAFTTALISMLMGTLLMGALMMFITQHFQLVQGLSPLRAGLWMVPAMLGSTVGVLCVPLVARRIRAAYLISGGLVVSAGGLLLLTQVGASGDAALLATAFTITNIGATPMITLATGIMVGSAPVEKAGSAAALAETSGEFGFAVGIAVLGSIGTAVYRSVIDLPAGLSSATHDAAADTIVGAVGAAGALPGRVGEPVLLAAREAFTSGLHVTAALSAVTLLGVAVLVATQLRKAGTAEH